LELTQTFDFHGCEYSANSSAAIKAALTSKD